MTRPIILLTSEQLVAIIGCSDDAADLWANPLSGAAVIHEINTPLRLAYWLSTIAHESQSLTKLEEDLNYTAGRMMQVWPSRFPTVESAAPYAYNPEKLANKVYANRMGNGDEASGDGWRYRGRGPIMLTGKTNYIAAEADETVPNIVKFPELVTEVPVGAVTAGWFWAANNLNELADADRFDDVVRRVNGGLIGYQDRLRRLEIAKKVLL